MVLALAIALASVIGIKAGDRVAHHNQQAAVQQYRVEQAKHIPHKTTKALLKVPSWGSDYVMPIKEGVSDRVLDSGAVGHFPHTGPVGVGNYVLGGHVVTHGEPFKKLLDMHPGQIAEVEKDGKRYIFTATRKFNVDYHNTSVLHYVPKTLTMITCASRLFHTDQRTVVVFKLTRVT